MGGEKVRRLTVEQLEFFKNIGYIKEEFLVLLMMKIKENIALNEEQYKILEELIEDKYVDSIAEIMEMIDGYGGLSYELDLINKESKKSIRDGIQLHDVVMEYIYYNNK